MCAESIVCVFAVISKEVLIGAKCDIDGYAMCRTVYKELGLDCQQTLDDGNLRQLDSDPQRHLGF